MSDWANDFVYVDGRTGRLVAAAESIAQGRHGKPWDELRGDDAARCLYDAHLALKSLPPSTTAGA